MSRVQRDSIESSSTPSELLQTSLKDYNDVGVVTFLQDFKLSESCTHDRNSSLPVKELTLYRRLFVMKTYMFFQDFPVIMKRMY